MKGRGPVTRKAGRAEIFRKGLRIRGLEESGTILNAEFKARKLSSWSANHSIIQVTWVRGSEIPRGSRLNRFPVSGSFRSSCRRLPRPSAVQSQSLLRQRIIQVRMEGRWEVLALERSQSLLRQRIIQVECGNLHCNRLRCLCLNRFFVSESFRSIDEAYSIVKGCKKSQSLLRQRIIQVRT